MTNYTKIKKRWNNEENRILENKYFTGEKGQILQLLPNRTWNSIVLHANQLNLSRDSGLRNGDLSVLLSDTHLVYYWIGFMLADAHFNLAECRLHMSLAIKDKLHLEKLALLLQTNVSCRKNICSLAIKHTIPFISVVSKFGISNQKSINPPNISWVTDELLLSLFIGFIDGDGCIRKQSGRDDAILSIKVHKNWLGTLQYFESKLYEISGQNPYKKRSRTRINNAGYAVLNISDRKFLQYLKSYATINSLPVLERKWNNINDKPSRYETSKLNRAVMVELRLLGFTNSEIAKKLGVSKACITKYSKEIKS